MKSKRESIGKTESQGRLQQSDFSTYYLHIIVCHMNEYQMWIKLLFFFFFLVIIASF